MMPTLRYIKGGGIGDDVDPAQAYLDRVHGHLAGIEGEFLEAKILAYSHEGKVVEFSLPKFPRRDIDKVMCWLSDLDVRRIIHVTVGVL